MDQNITININVGSEGVEVKKPKITKKKTKNGKESILEMPYDEAATKTGAILDMMGI